MTQLRQNPLDFVVLDELRQHCESTGSFAVWAEALEHHANAAGEADVDPVELGRLHYELGNLYRDQLGNADLALQHYRSAYDFDAAQRPAIAGARGILAERGAWPEVATLLEQEAESLPPGAKRSAAYAELAELQRERLDAREDAVNSLLEAIEAAPDDLQPRHALATMLLDDADQTSDEQEADDKRDAAADLLAGMASEVSDDYALAYLEAALDAVPDHDESLTLLETLAPRMERGDVLAPRWLAAIRAGRDPGLVHDLRLRMARAYLAVGQLDDARICLEPLLAQGDPEAMELARQSANVSSVSMELPPSEELPFDTEAASDSMSEELAAIESLGRNDKRDSLADLAMLDRRDQAADAPEPEPSPERTSHVQDVEPERASQPHEEVHASQVHEEADGVEPDTASGRESLYELIEQEFDENERISKAPIAPIEAPRSSPPPLPRRATSEQPRPSASLPPSANMDDDDPFAEDSDPFAEQTQPRVQPLTLAELNALTGEDHTVLFAPAVDDAAEANGVPGEVTHVSPTEDPAATELRGLRTELAKRLRFRDRRGAAEVAEVLLSRGLFDAEAISAMEEHYRLSRDFKKLRDLCERLAAEPSFGSDVRAGRLREAVLLCESKLGDQEGAVRNLRALLALEPDDAEAFSKLRTSLRRAQNWNDLAELLKTHADSLGGAAPGRAELYRELGALHRERRSDYPQALSAYAAAAEIEPGNVDDAVVLSGLYAGAGRYAEAASMYELRVQHAEADEQPALLATLAQVYEEKLHDDAHAQQALERWRALEPNKAEPLNALVRVLERRGEFHALVEALTAQLEQVPAAQRGPMHARIAQVAFDKLGDSARAADSYGEAIALAPQDASLWQIAAPAYENAGRSLELDELLWGIANSSRDRANASLVFDHLAITREARGDLAGAIAAREAQYALTQEVSALQALVELLRGGEHATELSRRLDELARKSGDEEARALRFERADLLADKLNDPEAAKAELELILAGHAEDAAALRRLVELCKLTGDVKRRASAQERLIKLAPSLAARVELAVELIDIYEQELADVAGAVRVLNAWTSLEPSNPTPYMRLLPLLAQTGKKRDQLVVLDKLAELANSAEESGEYTLRAARVAMEIDDWDGAWNRLVPRVVDHDDETAERLLREVTKHAQRGEQLSSLYVGLAQRATSHEIEQKRWRDAARTFEQELGAFDRALEATLRALAKQLDNRELLSEAERLTAKAHAWGRLGQVYDAIVRKADRTDARIELLMRHARLLEQQAEDQPAAFERVWLAFQLDAANDHTYAESKRLAIATGRREELLGSYERRTQSNASRESRLEALLDACALAQTELGDSARATGYLSRAVALAGDSNELLTAIEQRARGLSTDLPAQGRSLITELAGVYEALAPEYPRAPQLASVWLARASKIHEHDLQEPIAAYGALERASELMPGDEALLDELARVAELSANWDALAKHLQHAADIAIDSNSSSAALRRLGALCERELASPSRAADAYEQLVRLRPKDVEASRRLRLCLKEAERHDELLIAIDRELFVLKPEEKRELLKQAAETWEFGLKNRYEAVDAWKKVAALAPADPDAVAALARLRLRPRADDSLLSEEVVVTSEDLRPSQAQLGASSLFASAAASAKSATTSSFLRRSEPTPSVDIFGDELPPSEELPVSSTRDLDADVTMPLDTTTRELDEDAREATMTIPVPAEPVEAVEASPEPAEAQPVEEAQPEEESEEPEEDDKLAHLAPLAASASELPAAFSEPTAAEEADHEAAELAPQDELASTEVALSSEDEELDELLDEELIEEEDPAEVAVTRPPPPSVPSTLASLTSMVDRKPPSKKPSEPASARIPPPPPRRSSERNED